MARSHEPLKGGYDVDENAVRFSNYFHVLRELVHLSCGWLPLEPRLETKYLLGDHLHDDARAVTKIKRRLYELRTPSNYPGAPCDELCEILDRANAATTSPRCSTAQPPRRARPSTSRSPTVSSSRR